MRFAWQKNWQKIFVATILLLHLFISLILLPLLHRTDLYPFFDWSLYSNRSEFEKYQDGHE